MRQKLGRILLSMTALAAAFVFSPADIYAAGSVSVTADKTDVGVSDTITVYVKTSEPEDPSVAPEISITYDADKLEVTDCNVAYGGGGGLLTITGTDAQITMKALAAGNAAISAEAIIDDDGNNPATGSTSVVVGGNTAANLSSDATLRALTVSPGSLSPAFTPQGTEYTIEVDDSVTDITVSGGVTDEKAQITAASGFKNLKSGTNEAVITVTAEDGSTMTYHFTITRGGAAADETEAEEAEPEQVQPAATTGGLTFTADGAEYTISETVSDEQLPTDCSKTEVSYGGQTVEGAIWQPGGLTLLYAQMADGEGSFFIYDSTKNSFQIFVQIMGIENHYIVPVASQESVPDGFTEENLQWNNSYLPAYQTTKGDPDLTDAFYLLYAYNNEGNAGFYLYDVVEGSFQRYFALQEAAAATEQMGQKPILIIGTLAFLLVCAIVVIINLILHNRDLKLDMEEEALYGDEEEEKKAEVKQSKKDTAKKPEEKVEKQAVKKTEEKAAKQTAKKPETKPEKQAAKKVAEKPAAEKPEKQAVKKAKEKPVQQTEKTVAKQVKPEAKKEPVVKKEVTPNGVTYTTGQIPITVVQPPKPAKRSQVPIYTLEREPVPLTREAPADQLDDDFEFEFIDIDS
ncbi:cadherin-like beta sandwich domain-containing protein [Kineothrix sp. MSJ-39]|uniref:cadherin-like beta sandwich domain-containing protein n=1 Tax=Kineothrix sp. MSJ-39 TaxID=2841533 RepID=UPI001C1031EA|nr:cadherin-like beta sandwich domain-containing protein [Kineothrix sp. MSJ-39]MBU5430895.1 cadherin-like beta sandwich domain-containing protein [Kineothrix sp. MSJ-39]